MECSEMTAGNYSDSKVANKIEDMVLNEDKGCVEESADKNEIARGSKLEESKERLITRKAMIDHLSTSSVLFKSLEEEDEELDKQTKIDMAEELLDKNYGLFLAKFGNHLLKEHLCYFENRNEEESVIVDLHLMQIKRALEQSTNKGLVKTQMKSFPIEEMEVAINLSSAEKSRLNLRKKLLDHLSLSTEAHFKSQQVGEADLNVQEKRDIAEALLDRNASLFLARFGTHLLEEHLAYFDHKPCIESYEVEYYLRQLRKTHCQPVSKIGIKNRRFEALKKMVEDGSYFCEAEMRNRNPLLYEQLVGRFLTADERRERLNNIDTTNITFVNLLLEQMDREKVKKLRKAQEEEEDAMEEVDSCGEQMEEDEDDSEEDNDLDKTLWGEEYDDGNASVSKKAFTKKEEKKTQEKINDEDIPELSEAERDLLMEEFRSHMFSSFLQGKDTDFDYSQVDYNSDYDDLEAQGQDEEEKYFDEESSQDASCDKMSDEEDLLEEYMNGLEHEPTPQQLADKMKSLSHKDT